VPKASDACDATYVEPTAKMAAATHGWRAKCLQRLIRLNLPVPVTCALSFAAVRAIAAGHLPDAAAMMAQMGDGALVSIRPSPENPNWGGPASILNIGLNARTHAALATSHGQAAADTLYLRFVQAYSVHVARLDPDRFAAPEATAQTLAAALAAYEDETDEPFPQDPAHQLTQALRSMARAWEGTTARLLRQAKGAPAEAGLGLIVQRMALGLGPGVSGSGVIQFVDGVTGTAQITGRYMAQSLGRDALAPGAEAIYLTRDARGDALQDLAPEAFAELLQAGAKCRRALREEMQIEFTIENGQ
jgi:pyruvate,orthophosphate dikinase